ncbi:hypothetical protein D1007_59897 [Hordeum vulgare]|nr:hypothetical protein D1007_59897 [Hordeum vulgare]
MDKIPPETRAVYELLCTDFDAALDKSASKRDEATVSPLAKHDSKLDLLLGRIDDVKLSISVDLDELRGDIGADRRTHIVPSSASVSPRVPQLGLQPPIHDGLNGSDGFLSDLEQRHPGSKYVPSLARGCTYRLEDETANSLAGQATPVGWGQDGYLFLDA